jgi:hypothetical protein
MAGILRTDTIQNSNTSTIITQTNSTTITIGTTGQTVALASGASQSGFGRAGSVNWDTTPKTTGFTAVSGNGYFVNTTSGAITVTLPATPTAGDIVAIADYNGTAATNNITIGRNSSNINGTTADSKININYSAVTFVYVDSTTGWRSVDSSNQTDFIDSFITATGGTVLTCGNFKTHVFTGPGTFSVSSTASNPENNKVEYLVVAGGGGGGSTLSGAGAGGGGGGAGGYITNYPTTSGLLVTATSYPISVGSGGAGATFPSPPGSNGTSGNPSIFSTITSTGGGGGSNSNSTGATGGSGGGAGGDGGTPRTGAAGNTPPVSPPQGNPGGNTTGNSPAYGGGGGGGAGAAGTNGTSPAGQPGGVGSPIATTIFGPTAPSYGTPGPAPGRYFAGGGGGGSYRGIDPAAGVGSGGSGGGGGGNSYPSGTPTASGTVNTGGGGGGSGGSPNGSQNFPGGSGGSGIVVIRYKYQ